MHAISSYRGNRPTNKDSHKPTKRQDRLQYAVPLSLARSVITGAMVKELVSLYGLC